MAFSGQSFPTLALGNKFNGIKIEHSIPSVVVANSGYEYRALRFSFSKMKWTIPTRNFTWQDKETLLQFYNQMGGMLQSFLFTDPEHNTLSTYTLGTSSGQIPWLIPALIPVAGILHPIYHMGGLTLSEINATIVIQNGLPYFSYALGVTTGTTVTISGTYSLAARFDMSASFALANAASPTGSAAMVDSLKLVEVFE